MAARPPAKEEDSGSEARSVREGVAGQTEQAGEAGSAGSAAADRAREATGESASRPARRLRCS